MNEIKKKALITGQLVFDQTKPDGAPRKLMDTSKLNAFGWSPTIGLREGLQSSYDWFVANQDQFRGQKHV